jgi:hypothetical protein
MFSIDVTKLLGPSWSKRTTVREALEEVVTPSPKTACRTRWPSANAGSAAWVTGGGTARGGDTLSGRLGGSMAGLDGNGAGDRRRFGAGVWASR